jgi:hypothetical protein
MTARQMPTHGGTHHSQTDPTDAGIFGVKDHADRPCFAVKSFNPDGMDF